MTNDLKNHVKANKAISHVYFNEDGEWQFHKRPGFDTVFTRDEILASKVSDTTNEVKKDSALSTTLSLVTNDSIESAADALNAVNVQESNVDTTADTAPVDAPAVETISNTAAPKAPSAKPVNTTESKPKATK